MKLTYVNFNNNDEAIAFLKKLNSEMSYPVKEWFLDNRIYIYGYYYYEAHPNWTGYYFFVFGKTLLPNNDAPQNQSSIFSQLKQYGSSKKYKGLINISGEIVLANIYDEIKFFLDFDCGSVLEVTKNEKKGLVCIEDMHSQARTLTNIIYDAIFYANEYTIGVVKDNLVGFLGLNGQTVIEPKYIQREGYNIFVDGQATVCLALKNGVEHYINHYGDCIGYPEYEESSFGNGTGYYPYGELPSASDAYEGDSDAYWNTD